jgi:hypothetical protein
MKRIITLLAIVCIAMNGFSQDDHSAAKDTAVKPEVDTIRVGNMIIVRSGKDRGRSYFDSTFKHFRSDNPNITTNWFIFDIGLSQVNDQTDYGKAVSNGVLPAGATKAWFDQRDFKSTNINIWFFIQRLNMIEHVVNLKYGLGIELNNYRYTENIRYQKVNNPLVVMDAVDYKKNKLAADYITVPLMLNFDFTPGSKRGFGLSAGVSGGYLYSARQKTVGGGMGKKKEREDFDLRKFKLSYIGELGIGPVRLYASYATKSMFENTLDQTPFNFGIRLSNF